MNKVVRILFIFVVVVLFTCEASRVSAQTSQSSWLSGASGYARALQLQKELKVPLIVYFYADWCPYCRKLDDNYLPTQVAQDYLQHVVKVRINPEAGPAERDIADRYNVTGYPRFYLFRNVATPPVNIQPFRRNSAMTPEEWIGACRAIAPVANVAAPVQNVTAPVSKKVIPSVNRVDKVDGSMDFLPGPIPSLDQVIDNYVAASGGLKAQLGFTSRVIKGRLDAPGIGHGGRFEIYRKAPNKSLTIINLDVLGINKHGFDGQQAWKQTSSGLRTASGPALSTAASHAQFYRDVNLKQSYVRMKVLGKVKQGWREVYVVEGTPRVGTREILYFDVESGLLIRRDESHPTSRGMERAEIYFGDWRVVDGIKIPFQQIQVTPSLTFVMNFEEVKHNVQVDDALFRKPAN